MFKWRTSKEIELLYTLSVIASGMVLLVGLDGPQTILNPPPVTKAGLGFLFVLLGAAFVVLGGMLEPGQTRTQVEPPPLWARLVSVAATAVVMAAIFTIAIKVGFPRLGIILAGLLATPTFLQVLAILFRPR